jgi:starch synthase (maltosyl-transferring)
MTHKELPRGRERVVIERVRPEVDGGRFAAKAAVGDLVEISAEIFCDGHERVAARLLHRRAGESEWTELPMALLEGDRYAATIPATALGVIEFTIEAWVDRYESWRHGTLRKASAAQEIGVELHAGAAFLDEAAGAAPELDAEALRTRARTLYDAAGDVAALEVLLDQPLSELMRAHLPRLHVRPLGRVLTIVIERERARFGAWYELFPRSASPEPGRHGTFDDVIGRLAYVAAMGFDVLYLPPIHPIGDTFRKGKNNATAAEPGDVGSPWAIGAAAGGHTAIHPALGTLDDFDRLVAAAREHRLEIALDIAFQCSPDHPWVTEHPQWFAHRADGTIQYAENPPKKYQDVYPFDFESEDYLELWKALADVFRFWIRHGVEIFRVDNPHTKPFDFWEWLIAEIRRESPGVVFLAEAFARPNVMYRLGKLGFSQSYNYFPWKNARWELEQYYSEITDPDIRAFLRPASWVNTPDILNAYLQVGGRPASIIRLILAATLSANYGVYGPVFELCETRPREPASEEYLDSEKYQLRTWDLDADGSLRPLCARINAIRRSNDALRGDGSLQFHPCSSEEIICFSKSTPDLDNVILVACNVDPHHGHDGWVELDLSALGIEPDQTFQVHDLLTGSRYLWRGSSNYVALDPHHAPAHIFRVLRRARTEHDFEYFL